MLLHKLERIKLVNEGKNFFLYNDCVGCVNKYNKVDIYFIENCIIDHIDTITFDRKINGDIKKIKMYDDKIYILNGSSLIVYDMKGYMDSFYLLDNNLNNKGQFCSFDFNQNGNLVFYKRNKELTCLDYSLDLLFKCNLSNIISDNYLYYTTDKTDIGLYINNEDYVYVFNEKTVYIFYPDGLFQDKIEFQDKKIKDVITNNLYIFILCNDSIIIFKHDNLKQYVTCFKLEFSEYISILPLNDNKFIVCDKTNINLYKIE